MFQPFPCLLLFVCHASCFSSPPQADVIACPGGRIPVSLTSQIALLKQHVLIHEQALPGFAWDFLLINGAGESDRVSGSGKRIRVSPAVKRAVKTSYKQRK
jgi:hypothetical protein